MADSFLDKVVDNVGSGFRSKARYNKALRKSTDAMEAGTLGPSQAEKSQAMRGAGDAAQQQAAAAVGDVAEMVGGAPGMMDGAATKALMGAAAGAAEAGAGAQTAINAQAAQIAESRRRETMDALNEQRKEANEFVSKLITGGGQAMAGGASGEQSGAGNAAAIAQLMMAMCWVAREVLPGQWRDCRTYILFGAPKWFRSFYIKRGPGIAIWLCHNPWAKIPLRPLFRYFARRGKKMGQENPVLIEAQSHLL
tara:strand:- start:1795 stop:2550 length:756 start_codon:yes stop_codon:yes gene_type:complete